MAAPGAVPPQSNLSRYKKDLDSLIELGEQLMLSMQRECFPERFDEEMKKHFGEKAESVLKELPAFKEAYQRWYSEAKALIRQLLPDRLEDFVRHYEKPTSRKDIGYENYKMIDYLQGLAIKRGTAYNPQTIVEPSAAVPQFQQQLDIVKAVKARFESSLFDIRQLVQADLFDSELDAAEELAKHKFSRAADALVGVVLERHLGQVCGNHKVKLGKQRPTIADLNDALRNANIIEVPEWRFIQHLADIRNLCDHNKNVEPTPQQVDELIAGVKKITKTLF